jgi:hypothetical protein
MHILAEVVPDFVKILGYGLSGFAFLLCFCLYAFKASHKQIDPK